MIKNFKLQVLTPLLLCAFALNASAQTPLVWTNASLPPGINGDTVANIKAQNNPIIFNGLFYWLPRNGTNVTTTNGVGGITLWPGHYTMSFAGIPQSWDFTVTNSTQTLNIADLTDPKTIVIYSGVQSLVGLGGITIYPPTGGGGAYGISNNPSGGGGSATNAYQSQAGNNLIQITTNGFTYTFTVTSQTNGYPWGPLYDAAGTALATSTASTNGYPWGALYDAVGAAHNATNGYPWSALYDALNTALNATNHIGVSSGVAAFVSTNRFASAQSGTTAAAELENRGITLNGFQASISTAGDNGFNISDADGSTLGITGAGFHGHWTNASAIPPIEFDDTANNPFFILNGGVTGGIWSPAGFYFQGSSTNLGNLTANQFIGDGSKLTNMPPSTNYPYIAGAAGTVGQVLYATGTNNPTFNSPIYTNGAAPSGGTGGGTVNGMVASNYFVINTNLFVWDVAKVQKLALNFETNLNTLVISNAYYLTNGEAQLETQEDTNGTWKISSIKVVGGILRTNPNNWRGTNASQSDEGIVRLDSWGTNAWVNWATNLQPATPFTNSLAGGGGGGGGSSPYITAFPSDSTGSVPSGQDKYGFKFTVGAANMIATDIGFRVNSGNTGVHTLEIYDNSAILVVSTTVDLTGQTAGTVVYSAITPTTLTAGASYFCLIDMTTGETYQQDTSVVTTTADATIIDSAYHDGTGFHVFTPGAHSFGIPNLKYHL